MALMDYPLDWRGRCLFHFFALTSDNSKIFKNCNVILEFSDSPTQILVLFCPKKQSVGRCELNIF